MEEREGKWRGGDEQEKGWGRIRMRAHTTQTTPRLPRVSFAGGTESEALQTMVTSNVAPILCGQSPAFRKWFPAYLAYFLSISGFPNWGTYCQFK